MFLMYLKKYQVEVKAKKVNNMARRCSDFGNKKTTPCKYTHKFLRKNSSSVRNLNHCLPAVGKIVVKCNVKSLQQI